MTANGDCLTELDAEGRDTIGSSGLPAEQFGPSRIFFLNRFFYPDHSATSQILGDLAFYLAERGHAVHVFTSRQRYDDPSAQLPAAESVDGVAIHRLSTTQFGRGALVGRGFDYFSFYAAMWRSVLAWTEPGDIVVAKTDPPLLGVPVMQAVGRRGLHLVNWLQDLYPEVASNLGVPVCQRSARRCSVAPT